MFPKMVQALGTRSGRPGRREGGLEVKHEVAVIHLGWEGPWSLAAGHTGAA